MINLHSRTGARDGLPKPVCVCMCVCVCVSRGFAHGSRSFVMVNESGLLTPFLHPLPLNAPLFDRFANKSCIIRRLPSVAVSESPPVPDPISVVTIRYSTPPPPPPPLCRPSLLTKIMCVPSWGGVGGGELSPRHKRAGMVDWVLKVSIHLLR